MFLVFCIAAITSSTLPAQTTNIDSLKLELKSSDSDKDECKIVFEIFKYYKSIELVDSMNYYAKEVLNSCEYDAIEGKYMTYVIGHQFKQGLSTNIIPLLDSLITVMEDPDQKLKLLVKLSESSMFFEGEKLFNKYWAQAEKAFVHARADHARFLYYTFLGMKNQDDGNLFAALQSMKLASSFDNGVPQEQYLINELQLAHVYHATTGYEKAIEVCLQIQEEADEEVQAKLNSFILYIIMDCHSNLENYDEVIKLAHQSISYSKQHGNTSVRSFAYTMLGYSYLQLAKMSLDTSRLKKAAMNNGSNNTILPNYADSVLHYGSIGVQYSQDNHETKDLLAHYLILFRYYHDILKDYEKAGPYLLKIQKEDPQLYNEESLDEAFAELWESKRNYKKSLFYLKNVVERQSDKIDKKSEDVGIVVDIMEDSYEYKQTAESNLMKSEQKGERLRSVIILSILGLLLSGLFLFYVQRNRKKLQLLNSEIRERNRALDISNTKQKETIKYLDNFASVAAHDLKAPIRTATSFADLLSEKANDKLNEDEKEFLSFIGSSIANLSGMIDDLLSLSRLDTDLPEAKEIDLNKIISKVEFSLSSILDETNAKVIVESSLPKIMGHATLFSQLFQNVIKNATVHNKTGQDPIVKISSVFDNKSETYTIKVSDNSGGVPAHMIPRIFDLFSSTDKNSGNGIGLAICKKIVNHYGGEIWIDVDPGIGSTLNFTLR